MYDIAQSEFRAILFRGVPIDKPDVDYLPWITDRHLATVLCDVILC